MLALYIVGGIAFLILLILSIPVDVAFDLHFGEQAKSKARVGWMLGLVWKDIAGKERKHDGKPAKKGRRGMRSMLSLLRTAGLPGRILTLGKRVLSRVKIQQMDADIRIGLDDPADTGTLYSLFWPAVACFQRTKHVVVTVNPSFDEAVLEFSLRGRIRFLPIRMVGPIVGFALSPVVLRTAGSTVVSRWTRRR